MVALTYKYYVGTWTATPDFSTLTPTTAVQGIHLYVNWCEWNTGTDFCSRETINHPNYRHIYIHIPSRVMESNLYMGGYTSSNLVVTNNFSVIAAGKIRKQRTLTAGVYPIYVSYYYNKSQNLFGASLTVSYSGS
jgi:hypothetical protein